MFALDSMRLEKGYRTWKGDLSQDYTLLEAGLDRFVSLDKAEDFPGKPALVAERARGSRRRFASLVIEGNAQDAKAMSTIRRDGEVVGEVTSGGYGYRVQASIAHAMLRPDAALPGTTLEVDIFGTACRATVQAPGPLWDPLNARLRAQPVRTEA